jgi:formamidopyrimidine-DNA glycosylase
MPELPEVEAVARALRPLVVGRTIERCRVIHPIAVRPPTGRSIKKRPAIGSALAGQKVVAVERRGKYLLVALERGWLVLHFKFDGQLLWFDSGKLSGHVDVAFDMAHGTLGFVDPRHLAKVRFANSPEDVPGVRALGLDPLSRDFSRTRLTKLLATSVKPLKLFLLDQSKVAGIGNIYSSEAMWRARLNPRRRANVLTPIEAQYLHKAIGDILNRALECCLNPAPDFRDPQWWFQGLERILRVYGREGEKCRRCGRRIERMEQAGRSTFWCKHCQR